jgi:hypothetical protein
MPVQRNAWMTMEPPAWPEPRDIERIDALLKGAIDLHCHSGPSVMPRKLDHIEALEDAASAGMRALLIKDHYYSATPITQMLNDHYGHLHCTLLSGVPLNNTSGGFNIYAVDHGLNLGARLVWMPTFSAANHLRQDRKATQGFPESKMPLVPPEPLTALEPDGSVRDDVKRILDHVARHDAVLSGGHLHISEIFKVFEEARARGVKRLLINHPTYIIGATHADIRSAADMGVYIEHSFCMFIRMPNSPAPYFTAETLEGLITAGTVEKTILSSDLGQAWNAMPVTGFRSIIQVCIDLGYSDAQIRRMVSLNAADLMGLDMTGA